MHQMRAAFSFIYEHNAWDFGSGLGSLPETTLEYRFFLERFLAGRGIGSIVDFGCGDWQFSRYVYWWGARYTGYDVVPSVIEANVVRFGGERIRFLLSPESPDAIEPAELLILKDILQHWPTGAIQTFLALIRGKFEHILITNSITPAGELNREISVGEYRPLDLRLPPFNIEAECVLEYAIRCTLPDGRPEAFSKHTLYLPGGAAPASGTSPG